jgi:hypothetical protein
MTALSEVVGGRYRLAEVLGQGGMSDVYRAVDQRTGLAVAVKIVRSGDPEFARRLAQEARALELFEHPGLVRLLDTGVIGAQAYLVMELVNGSTLAQVLRDGRLTPARTARIGATLAGALAYVHARGIVHRDVKPGNVLVGADGEARLGDFGIARLMDASTMTMAGTTLGTAAYMAPEQLEDHQVGPAADIWSLGIVLLECLSGRRVFAGTPSEVVGKRLAGPVSLPADLPTPWRLLLMGMLDHQADRRLDGSEVAALLAGPVFGTPWEPAPAPVNGGRALPVPSAPSDLTALVPGAGAGSTGVLVPDDTRVAPPGAVPTSDRTHGRRWPVVLLGVVVVLLAVGLFFALGSSPALQANGGKKPGHPHAADPTTSTTTPPTTTTEPPTTTIPTGPAALAGLTRDVAEALDSGAIDAGTGSAITGPATRALIDVQAGRTQQAANQLQQTAAVIDDGVQNGSISPSEGDLLQSDVATLATALGLGQTAVSTTAPTTPVPTAPGPTGPGPGHGNGGGGKGH